MSELRQPSKDLQTHRCEESVRYGFQCKLNAHWSVAGGVRGVTLMCTRHKKRAEGRGRMVEKLNGK